MLIGGAMVGSAIVAFRHVFSWGARYGRRDGCWGEGIAEYNEKEEVSYRSYRPVLQHLSPPPPLHPCAPNSNQPGTSPAGRGEGEGSRINSQLGFNLWVVYLAACMDVGTAILPCTPSSPGFRLDQSARRAA